MMFSVRPVFIGWIVLLYQLPLQLFFTIWSALFFGGIMGSLHILPRNSWAPFVVFGGFAFVAVPLVAYLGKKLNCARTEYKFLKDRLEFQQGFFYINEKVIRFKDIKEVTLRKGIFQRMYDLGQYIWRLRRRRLPAQQCICCSRIWKYLREWNWRPRHPRSRRNRGGRK